MNAVARFCRPRFSPQGYWNQVEPSTVQQTLRQVFTRWGRPGRFRVDNGVPWGSKGEWPTDLALWLIGLEVEMLWNPPRRPQDNGVVERSQGTGKRWGEPKTCRDPAEVQRRLDDMDRIQREVYPSIDGHSRLQAFPELAYPVRPYSRVWEKGHWNMDLVLDHLVDYSVSRRVDSKGQVSVYNRNHYVGKMYSGREVYVQLDPTDRDWIFTSPEGTQLRRKAASEIAPERIVNLQVTHRR
jgi:transposase InsO family protein